MSDVPELPHEATNGTTPRGTVCPERRPDGALHCFHVYGSAMQNPTSGAVMFPNVCCFCAPTYMHLDILLPRNVADADIVAAQMTHGHLVTLRKQPPRGNPLVVPGR
jgi:hypothetical protein